MRDDLGAPALFEEAPLEEIRRPNHLAGAERKAQMGDASVEALEETSHERRKLSLIGVDEIITQPSGQRRRGRLLTGAGPALEALFVIE